MNIAILGGGFTGLTAAYELEKQGNHTITVFEKEKQLGGLASGFTKPDWDWSLERVYHHIFSSDEAILSLAKEINFSSVLFKAPETSSLYEREGNLEIFPLDTPFDLLKFPLLSIPSRLRVGVILALLKFGPHFSIYDKKEAIALLSQLMGKKETEILFGQLFQKKFGKYAEKILTSFMWARLSKRTKSLGYMTGGFQNLIDQVAQHIEKRGVIIQKGVGVTQVIKKGEIFTLKTEKSEEQFDKVIATLPTPIITQVCDSLLDENTKRRWRSINYLNATNLVLETEKPLLDSAYWLNICVPNMPMMVLVQHTNYMDKSHYNGKHILYIGNYIDDNDPILSMNAQTALDFFAPHLEKIKPGFMKQNIETNFFKAKFAQPIFDKAFVKNKPNFTTNTKGLYVANLDMTYPYDRGTNYAVALGKKVAALLTSSSSAGL